MLNVGSYSLTHNIFIANKIYEKDGRDENYNIANIVWKLPETHWQMTIGGKIWCRGEK